MIIDREMTYSTLVKGQEVTEDQIREELKRLKSLKDKNDSINIALKKILNSIYGVLGFKPFICYNRDVADAITAQSRNLIKFTIKIFDDYFAKYYHINKELHQKLGIETPQPLPKVVNYADTDSVMLTMEKVYEQSGFKGDVEDKHISKKYKLTWNPEDPTNRMLDFCFRIYEYGLNPYIKVMLKKYTDIFAGFQEKPDGEPSFKLDLEQINHSVLWLAKKKYIKDPAWDGGQIYQPIEKLQYKGIEINQKATPLYVRDKLKEIAEYLMRNGKKLDSEQLVLKLKAVKEEFSTISDISTISQVKKVNGYEKYVLNDTTRVELASGCPEHIRASAFYNYYLYNSKVKEKYSFIKSGSRVQYYVVQDKEMKVFGFVPGLYPFEFAIPMDIEAQYEKVFLKAVNNIATVLGVPKLNSDLMLFPGLL